MSILIKNGNSESTGKSQSIPSETPHDRKSDFYKHPKIVLIDFPKETCIELNNSNYYVYEGTLGSEIKNPNTSLKKYFICKPDIDIPKNFHEYDICIVDLAHKKKRDYTTENSKIEDVKHLVYRSLICHYPMTIFDSKPYSSAILRQELDRIKRKRLIILFADKFYKQVYYSGEFQYDILQKTDNEVYSNYDLLRYDYFSEARIGFESKVCKTRKDLYELLSKHKELQYNQTFHPPRISDHDKKIFDSQFVPLMKNINSETISFAHYEKDEVVFVFPQFKEKGKFVLEFLNQIAPSIIPELFPFSDLFKWKNDIEYSLPNYVNLLNEKEKLVKEFERRIEDIENKIELNSEKFSFLHHLLIETDDALVKSVVTFLEWLEFSDVRIKDEDNQDIKEEDIQIVTDKGLLIIEIKGIGGTSTDSDCSQISKIKHRRCKERNRFDVFALYIVNHQRYFPPIKRTNPPFNNQQIQDALNDERGLVTTYQLFNLYNYINNNILTKEEARNILYTHGLLEFRPKNLLNIGIPKHLYKKNHVAIIDLPDYELKVGDEVLIETNGNLVMDKIISMKVNDEDVTVAKNVEVGLQFGNKLSNSSEILIRINN